MKADDMNTETAANDLTQLSSREQLSALMDSALPADQTRFLLRRLRHDAPLAECWERWRIAGEVMRGLAPAQRMPADFAARVSAALHGDGAGALQARPGRGPGWLRWGGGAAIAASLAVVALMARQDLPVDASPPVPKVVAATAQPPAPAPKPAEQVPAIDSGSQIAAAATAVAAATPQRRAQRASARSSTGAQSSPILEAEARDAARLVSLDPTVQLPQSDIVTRPWPRSVLPQYAGGSFTVGLGEHVRGNPAYNPFQPQSDAGSLPPLSTIAPAGVAPGEAQAASGSRQDP